MCVWKREIDLSVVLYQGNCSLSFLIRCLSIWVFSFSQKHASTERPILQRNSSHSSSVQNIRKEKTSGKDSVSEELEKRRFLELKRELLFILVFWLLFFSLYFLFINVLSMRRSKKKTWKMILNSNECLEE